MRGKQFIRNGIEGSVTLCGRYALLYTKLNMKNINLNSLLVPPTFPPQTDTIITAQEGQTVQIPCNVFAMPFPDIKWTFNNNELNLMDNRYESMGGGIS